MRTKKKELAPVVLAVLMALLATVFAPMAWAADAKVVLSKDHTDEFYVTTDTGASVVKWGRRLHSRMYDPNDVEFQIQSDMYGKYKAHRSERIVS